MTKIDAAAPRYLATVFLAALLTAVLCFALAVFADPYRVFGSERFLPSPPLKPRAYQQELLAKIYLAQRTRMNTIVLGNSRVEIGIDPANGAWPAAARPVFDGGLSGIDLHGTSTLFREAVAKQKPKFMILGVDFQDFIGPGQDPRNLTPEALAQVKPRGAIQATLDVLTATITPDATVDSLATIFGQDPRFGDTMLANGFNPLHSYIREHPPVLFNKKLADYEQTYARYRPSNFSRPLANAEFVHLSAILKTCAQAKIRCTLIIYPYHATFLEMLHHCGLWNSFEAWKGALAKFVAADNPGVRIVDFSGYNNFTAEPLPSSGAPMKWYWEPGHFKAAFTDVIVASVFSGTGYGKPLTPANAASNAAGIRKERALYLRNLMPAHSGG